MATEKQQVGSVRYEQVDDGYFARRQLRRYAGVWSLWALGVGAVISGHFSGWNLGLASGGFGGLLIAALIIGAMYVALSFSLAEMSPALPHTGGAYSFARSAMGPWGGFVTGLAENMEYVLTPAVIVFVIGSYLPTSLLRHPEWQPLWWLAGYTLFVGLNLVGVELSFRVSLVVTLLALAVLAVFWISAIPHFDLSRWALNIGVGADGAPVGVGHGGGEFLPLVSRAFWRRCRSRCGCSWRLSNYRWPLRNRMIRCTRYAARSAARYCYPAILSLHGIAVPELGYRGRQGQGQRRLLS